MTQQTRILSILLSNFVDTQQFTNQEIYDCVRPMMLRLYPNNNTVDETIRGNLNSLVNNGYLTRVSNGVYTM